MDELVYWIWLSISCTVDTGTFSKLIGKFDGAKAIYEATEREISSCIGPKMSDRARLANKDLTRAEEIYDFCRRYGVGILKYSDSQYPSSLREIPTPPPLLYYRGRLPDFNSTPFVSVVGTRELSEYGRRNAFNFGYDLAVAGAVVVSGMALGIDSVALAGALAADRPTVAILGSGIDVCYPAQHLTLAREIVKSGCIMTEYPPGTKPSKYNFPKRNRIISGLSPATLVVEGRERSGSLITARYAKEQGKVVFAIPGNVGSGHSEVTNMLLKDGARLATSAEDILALYEKDYPGKINQFLLTDRRPVDMMYVLRSLEVVANCPSDDIYNQPWVIKRSSRPKYTEVGVTHYPAKDGPEADPLDLELRVASGTDKAASPAAPSERGVRVGSKRRAQDDNGVTDLPTEKSYGEIVLDRLTEKVAAREAQKAAELMAERSAEKQALKARIAQSEQASVVKDYKPMTRSASGVPAHFEGGYAAASSLGTNGLDPDTLYVFNKIPLGGAIEIEELTTESTPLRAVMKHLTRLESAKLIVVLPGGKVIRKY